MVGRGSNSDLIGAVGLKYTGSIFQITGSETRISSSVSITGSNAPALRVSGSTALTGSLSQSGSTNVTGSSVISGSLLVTGSSA